METGGVPPPRPLESRVFRRWRLALSGATLVTAQTVVGALRALDKFRYIHVLPGLAIVYGEKSERGSAVLRAVESALGPLGLRCRLVAWPDAAAADDDAAGEGGVRWGVLPRAGRPLKSPLGM